MEYGIENSRIIILCDQVLFDQMNECRSGDVDKLTGMEMACFVSVNSNCESLTGLCDFLPITLTLVLIKLPTSYVKLLVSLHIVHLHVKI